MLILKFGVLEQVHPPSKTLRGLFVLACAVAGGAGGAITIFFWKLSRYLIGGWGGFALALFIQCFRDGGLIRGIGYRWIMFIGVAVVGFCICTVPKIHYHVMLVSTGFVGATAVMLGIDCFTTAGLKEFYMWNLGFMDLFPKYADNNIQFPVTQVMQIELGLMVAVALMGIALQFRILKLLQRKLKEISDMQKQQDEDEEHRAAERFASLDMEKQEWEAQRKSVLHHGRNGSDLSDVALLEEGKGSSPGTPQPDDYTTLVGGRRRRYQSGASDLMTDEGLRSQSPGAIPALDLGKGIEGSVPQDYLADSKEVSRIEEEVRTKEKLRQEIEDIRKSLIYLEDSNPSRSHHASLASRTDLIGHRDGSRSRTNSVELGAMMRSSSMGVTRPKSAPLQEDWDTYVRDRKLLQPPAGVSAPIQPIQRASMSSAILDAVANRQKIESMFGVNPSVPVEGSSSNPYQPIPQRSQDGEDVPLAFVAPSNSRPSNRPSHVRSKSVGLPTILPPQKASRPHPAQEGKTPPSRVATYEELAERHQRKIRDIQAPLTKAEREAADLGEAKRRWEKAKAIEKEAVTKRQADMAAALAREEKKKKKEQRPGSGPGLELVTDKDNDEQTKSLSADKLGTLPGGSANPNSKRMSVMKVEDWKRTQLEQAPVDEMGARKRESVAFPRNGSANQQKGGSGFLVRDPPR